jgi:hypothetical protein
VRIIIDIDEQGGVVVERAEGGRDPVASGTAAAPISVTDAGPPPVWLLRALGVEPAAARAAPELWDGEDGGAARA